MARIKSDFKPAKPVSVELKWDGDATRDQDFSIVDAPSDNRVTLKPGVDRMSIVVKRLVSTASSGKTKFLTVSLVEHEGIVLSPPDRDHVRVEIPAIKPIVVVVPPKPEKPTETSPPATLKFAARAATVKRTKGENAVVRLELVNAPVSSWMEVALEFKGGTAVAGEDYRVPAGSNSLKVGAEPVEVTIPILDQGGIGEGKARSLVIKARPVGKNPLAEAPEPITIEILDEAVKPGKVLLVVLNTDDLRKPEVGGAVEAANRLAGESALIGGGPLLLSADGKLTRWDAALIEKRPTFGNAPLAEQVNRLLTTLKASPGIPAWNSIFIIWQNSQPPSRIQPDKPQVGRLDLPLPEIRFFWLSQEAIETESLLQKMFPPLKSGVRSLVPVKPDQADEPLTSIRYLLNR